ncbi:hypothetical protein KY285_005583 [Solanum tuberosum]|nr:hypothetical protein KY285_005583 [Solanum tuberosum]
MPAIIMWTFWKRRNNIKHGGNTTYNTMVEQVHDLVRKLVKVLYPWIRLERREWAAILDKLKDYMPKVHYHKVTWSPHEEGKLKCNFDEACRGNPGMGSYGFCLRNHTGDLMFAKAKGIGMTTNMEAEALAIYEALSYCHDNGFRQVIIETDSLCLKRMILKQWRVPWEMVEMIEEIRNRLQQLKSQIIHRERNMVADALELWRHKQLWNIITFKRYRVKSENTLTWTKAKSLI